MDIFLSSSIQEPRKKQFFVQLKSLFLHPHSGPRVARSSCVQIYPRPLGLVRRACDVALRHGFLPGPRRDASATVPSDASSEVT